jgi:hypothetical protein
MLQALQGVGHRAVSRGLRRAGRPVVPRLPDRPRLGRLFTPPQDGRQAFLAAPTVLGGPRYRRLPQGGIVGWAWATAQVAANPWQGHRRPVDGRLMVLRAPAGPPAVGALANLPRGQRGAWQERRRSETGLSRLPVVCHGKSVMPRVWASGQARLASTMAALKGLVPWHDCQL